MTRVYLPVLANFFPSLYELRRLAPEECTVYIYESRECVINVVGLPVIPLI